MYVRQLALHEFRNYEARQLDLPRGVVVFCGPNGAGKTNLLEAVYLSSTGESPRAREVAELVRFGQEYAFVRTLFAGLAREVRLEVGLSRAGQRQLKVNGVVRRRTDLIGVAPVVLFSAEDIVVLRGDPAGRRRVIDVELSALSHPYYLHLNRYRRTLEQRNRLLKDLRAGRGRREALDPWDRAAARYGAQVMVQRRHFLSRLNQEAAQAHARLTGDGPPFCVRYTPSCVVPDEQEWETSEKSETGVVELVGQKLEGAFRERRELDIHVGATTCGPHRDDLELLLGDRPLRAYGSQGQQRAAALAVRLGLAAVAEQLTGEQPVLLLDDVLSELDERSREGVLTACRTAEQAVITACDLADLPIEAREHGTVFEVRDGRIL